MSGLFKSIGKIFKKVVNVVKKIALPALAIAAVVVTGGAALGLLPGIAGLGGLAASLGASPLVAGVLSAAGTGATIGAIGGLITTGSISGAIKGATTGFLTGAAAGGISAAFGGVTGTAGGLGKSAFPVVNGVDPLAPLPAVGSVGDAAGTVASGLTGAGQAASGIGGAVASAAPSVGNGGGILGFLNRNPLIASGVLKGIGGALTGDPTINAMKMRARNYQVSNVFQPYDPTISPAGQDPAQRYNQVIYGDGQYEYDPQSGRILPKVGA